MTAIYEGFILIDQGERLAFNLNLVELRGIGLVVSTRS